VAKKSLRSLLPWLILGPIAAFAAWKLHTSHFDWHLVAVAFQSADIRLIVLAVAVILVNYFLRAMRWAVFLRPSYKETGTQPIHWWSLVGPQFVGFTGLAILGRVGELIRPWLVSRRTGFSFSSQVAVVMVERIFDLGAFGLIFSLNLLLAPQLQTLPFLHKAGLTIGGLTVGIAVFVAGVRLAGTFMAGVAQTAFGAISRPAGEFAAKKILEFRAGLNVIDSLQDFFYAAALSLLLWGTIAATYLLTLRAFPAPVSNLTLAHTIVLMGFSIAGSALPIPGGGGAWAGNVFALTNLFGVPTELAAGAGLMVWVVTTLSVIPFGLVYAKVEGISIRQVAERTEQAEEALLQAEETAAPGVHPSF
jgi:uncharacterized protein (TIRG00374 family)